jgi:hypothetical protein
MAITKLNIYNLALIQLGQSPITDLATVNPTMVKLNALYQIAIKGLLEEQRWDFATKHVVLTLATSNNLGAYDKKYTLPSDLMKITLVYSNPDDPYYTQIPHEVQFDGIYTNSDTVYIEYIYDITGAASFHTSFAEALAFRLAALCSPAVYHSVSTTNNLAGRAAQKQSIAINKNNNRSPQKATFNSSWLGRSNRGYGYREDA